MADGPGPEQRRAAVTFAYPEYPARSGSSAAAERAAWRQGARAFTLWRDAGRGEALAHVVTTAAARRQGAAYAVLDPAGNRLAEITRRPAGFFRRARWTVQPAGAEGAAVGAKGDLRHWIPWRLCWVFLPASLAIVVVVILALGTSPTPRRIAWRVGEQTVLRYTDGPALYELRLPAAFSGIHGWRPGCWPWWRAIPAG
ncbi:hypothetical protein [Streptomyces litchfieldiae]|uniref:Uncharacterized protein n=1 Tax=Streptomyces litchfieldiae TaxID=3075543 RepID=A0ABU2MR76_9ACTN|nr:hypothetical protein [Streptomyces sp. DSM 44938]MDT0344135.1 hypothetical protein [Streptomyces sp. DSM 44938]